MSCQRAKEKTMIDDYTAKKIVRFALKFFEDEKMQQKFNQWYKEKHGHYPKTAKN